MIRVELRYVATDGRIFWRHAVDFPNRAVSKKDTSSRTTRLLNCGHDSASKGGTFVYVREQKDLPVLT